MDVYGTYNELVTGAFVNQQTYNWGGPHITYQISAIHVENGRSSGILWGIVTFTNLGEASAYMTP